MTIGYGHTGREVFSGLVISQQLADEWLVDDLSRHAAAIAPAIKVPVGRNQYIALLSFAFNVGAAAFKRSSVLKNLNAGAPMQAAESFKLWVKAGGKTVTGLVRRRAAESKLFLKPDED
jgi:lysozyme